MRDLITYLLTGVKPAENEASAGMPTAADESHGRMPVDAAA